MMTGYLRVTHWDRYQHYKNRRPPWVKFYVDLLDPESKLNRLPVTTRFLFDRMLLLAANFDNRVPKDSELLARLLRMDAQDVDEAITNLLKGRYLTETKTKRRASNAASNGASRALAPELETEGETETEREKGFTPPTSDLRVEATRPSTEDTAWGDDDIPF